MAVTISEQNRLNRKRGEKFEINIMNRFKIRSDVLHVMHSAGSFGTWDLIITFMNGETLFISAKMNGYHTEKERKKILRFMKRLGNFKGKPRMEMWYYKSARKVAKKRIKTERDVEMLRVTYR